MKVKQKFNTLLTLLLVFFASFTFGGCNWGTWFQPDLDPATITINSNAQTISWQNVTNVEEYDVYANEVKVATVVGVKGINTYNFSEVLKDSVAVYKFYLICVSDGYNSSVKSNVVTYLNSTEGTNVVSDLVVNNSNLNAVTDLVVGSNILSWNQVAGVETYYVFMYTNTLGECVFETKVNAFDFSEYVDEDDVIMFRVGIKNEDDIVSMSLPLYHNTCTLQPAYNNKMFCLDGVLGDYYITGQDELNQIVYYAFIYRVEKLSIYISPSYMNEIVNTYGTTYSYRDSYTGQMKTIEHYHLVSAVGEACDSYTESCSYDTNLSNVTTSDYYKKDVTINFDFVMGKEPVNTTEKLRTQNEFDTPYYEKVDYEKRDSSFNDFASDKKLRIEYVSTCEELHHAVESGATPIFKSSTCSAAVMYEKAKSVLREIISNEMSEYEKVLSIFDYICYNTVYDDLIVEFPIDAVPSFASYTCFFLEGVFNDGLAVCDGFSKAFSLLCNMEGIDAYRITGSAKGGLHAWNKVKVDGSWYVVDITWTVVDTDESAFASGGEAVNFNSKEFLSYRYFLVSDKYIKNSHSAANTELNASLPALNEYYYYATQTYDGTNNLIISSNEEFKDLVEYMLETKQLSIQIAFDDAFITSPSLNPNKHDNGLTTACKTVKAACGISNSNILTIGYTHQKLGAQTTGTIYCITLINLPASLTA